jgi:hypothetical protein
MSSTIKMPADVFDLIKSHLLPENMVVEEVAFFFAKIENTGDETVFEYKDHWLLSSDDFVSQGAYYFELTDETVKRLIKQAHDLNTAIVEFHSHVNQQSAEFSYTDWEGFQEFVPHVFWRLKDRPYAAVVLTSNGFDALAWIKSGKQSEPIKGLDIESELLLPTNNSYKKWAHGSGSI